MTIRKVHRWISLAVAIVWLVQAITGTLSVFRWELDERTVPGEIVAMDFGAVGAAIDRLDAAPDTDVSSVWTSGTDAQRFDVHYSVGDSGRVVRLDGLGRSLRDRSHDEVYADGAIWDTITSIHTSLMAGDAGKGLIGLSGVLLLTNIFLGLKLAWPKRRTLRKVLFAAPKGGSAARLYGWHRKIGLWFAFPALLTITAGTMMVFSDGLTRLLRAELKEPAADTIVRTDQPIGFEAAIVAALRTFPGATFSGVSLPADDAPWYRVRVGNPGEVPRKWGTSVVYVGAADGRVLERYHAAATPGSRTVVDTLYALHTGQIGRTPGRVVVLFIGLGLLSLVSLGIPLWWVRHRAKVRTSRAGQPQARFE